MNSKRPAAFVKPANLQVPFGSESGTHYHIAIQFDQQGAHDLAANHYRAASESAPPGDFRNFCLDRYRALTIGTRKLLAPSAN